MIIPCPELPRRWSHYPVTLALVAANVVVYIMFFSGQDTPSAALNLSDRDLRTAGRLFMAGPADRTKHDWVADTKNVGPEKLETYGNLALRDKRFLKSLEDGDFREAAADPVALKALTESARKFHAELKARHLHRFGLSSERESGLAWLTYQFSHAGVLHLFSN